MDTLYIIVPAYNESENIKHLIDDWYPIIEKHNGNGKSRMVIINDGSRDRTWELLEEAKGGVLLFVRVPVPFAVLHCHFPC